VQNRLSIFDLDLGQLADWLAGIGQPSYRARQIMQWIYTRGVTDFAKMTDLPDPLRHGLTESLTSFSGRQLARSAAPDGTEKILLAWADGATTETVMIPAAAAGNRRTVCLSTQVGCDVGCRFCASGIGGALRNLTAGEVLEQAVRVHARLHARGERLSHAVFMGMGEPLANYETTVTAVRRLNAEWGLGLSQRRITISTVGLPKQIERLAEEGLQITLALSLHAPSDALRRELIPWAEGVPLSRLIEACRHYRERTGREVTFEYCLLAEVNDGPTQAQELARLAVALDAHVNLLIYNPVDGLPFSRPSRNRAIAFLRALRQRGAKAHLRESRGLEADAACGQLRRRTRTQAGSDSDE
jgi:23S rRNA (adenine2503-C2)-methyltransferase